MKNSKEFCKNQIKNNSKTVKYKFTVFVVVLCLNLVIILLNSYVYTIQEESFEKFGEWKSALVHVNKDEEDYIKKNNIHSYSYTLTSILMKEKDGGNIDLGTISSLDSNTKKLFHLQMLSGRMPQNEHEIAVEATVLSSLGIDYTLGKKIKLPVRDGKYLEFELIGILKPYRHRWNFPAHEELPSAIVTIKSKDKMLWMSKEEYENHDAFLKSNYINEFAFHDTMTQAFSNWKFLFGMVCSLLILFTLIFGILYLLFINMKRDFEILYKLGTATKDMNKLRFWIVFFIGRFTIILGMLAAIIVAYLGQKLIPSAFYVKIPWTVCLIVLCIVFVVMILAFSSKKIFLHKRNKRQKHHPRVFCATNKFNVINYTLRMIQVGKLQFILMIVLTCCMLFVQTICFFQQVILLETSKIEMEEQNVFDYIVFFTGSDISEGNPLGVNQFDIIQLNQMEECEDIFTIKENDLPYTFENQDNSFAWKEYMAYLDEDIDSPLKNPRMNPSIYGISNSLQARELLEKVPSSNDFWTSEVAIFNNLYFSVDIQPDKKQRSLRTTNEESSIGEIDSNIKEENVHIGTEIKFEDDSKLSVISLIESFDFYDQLSLNMRSEPYSIITNIDNFDKLAPLHKTVQYVYITVNDKADFYTDTQIMNIFNKYQNISVQNLRLHKEDIRSYLHKGMLLYSILEFVALFIWILLMIRLYRSKAEQSKETRNILNSLGIHKRFFIKNSLIESTAILVISSSVVITICNTVIHTISFETKAQNVPTRTHMLVEYIGSYLPVIVLSIAIFMIVLYAIGLPYRKERR